MDQIIEQLREYAELDDREWGKMARALINAWYCRSSMSDHFVDALENEIREVLSDVQANTQIVENEEVVTHTIKIKELVWYWRKDRT